MLNVFVKKSAEELLIQLSDGRMMTLEDLVRDYERLRQMMISRLNAIFDVSKLKVGEWFRIDREVIDKSKEEIRCKCNEAGAEGEKLWVRFKESNKIADRNPDQYPRLIETYIFEHNWNYKTEQEMRDMCENVGDGMCCEVICDLELQMRICNGEPVDDLVKKTDKLPHLRIVKLRNGSTGYFGGGVEDANFHPPANLIRDDFSPDYAHYYHTAYAFRRVLS